MHQAFRSTPYHRLMEIRQLKAFLAIAEAKTFTAGARRVNVTQAAISMQIRQLEDEVGLPIFTRTPRRVILTEAGEYLLEREREVLADLGVGANRVEQTGNGYYSASNNFTFTFDGLTTVTSTIGADGASPKICTIVVVEPDVRNDRNAARNVGESGLLFNQTINATVTVGSSDNRAAAAAPAEPAPTTT